MGSSDQKGGGGRLWRQTGGEGVTQILEGMASRNKEAFLFRLGRLKFWNWSQVAWGSLTPLPDPVENGGEETSGRINSPLLN